MTLVDAIVRFIGEKVIIRTRIYRYFRCVPAHKIDSALQIAVKLKQLNISHHDFENDEFSTPLRGRS